MHAEQKQLVLTQARESLKSLVPKLSGLRDGLDIKNLVDDFLGSFDQLPPYAGYKHIPLAARELQQVIQQLRGVQPTREFLYVCLLTAVLKSLESDFFANLPSRVKGHQLKQYRRIVEQSAAITEICELENDLFQKDLGLALLRLYAASAQLVDYRTGIGRSMVFAQGWGRVPQRLAIFSKLGGFKPYFEIHTHLSYLDEFNEEGWNECYRCCADLYSLHPKVLGMQGGSWFYDPALAEISPRLAYLRDVPREGGAHLLFTTLSAEQSIHDATATSPTRKALYDQGKYRPKNYTLIWSRDDQLRWSKTTGLNR